MEPDHGRPLATTTSTAMGFTRELALVASLAAVVSALVALVIAAL